MGHNYHCTTAHFLYFWTPDKFVDLMYLYDDQHLFFTIQKVRLETYLSLNIGPDQKKKKKKNIGQETCLSLNIGQKIMYLRCVE